MRRSNAIIGLLVGCSLLAMVLKFETWPFSWYPMFCTIQGDSFERIRVYCDPEDESLDEFQYLGQFSHPFGEHDMVYALARLGHKGGPAVQKKALNDCLDRYEQRRRLGHHDGPPLRALRLYHVRWQLIPDASNALLPDTRKLLLEVTGASGDGS